MGAPMGDLVVARSLARSDMSWHHLNQPVWLERVNGSPKFLLCRPLFLHPASRGYPGGPAALKGFLPCTLDRADPGIGLIISAHSRPVVLSGRQPCHKIVPSASTAGTTTPYPGGENPAINQLYLPQREIEKYYTYPATQG